MAPPTLLDFFPQSILRDLVQPPGMKINNEFEKNTSPVVLVGNITGHSLDAAISVNRILNPVLSKQA